MPSLVYILAFGAAEVLIVLALLVVESPVSRFARQAAGTWPGRIILALIGWGLISIFMIVVLTILERSATPRSHTDQEAA